jgi:hypothetical protein
MRTRTLQVLLLLSLLALPVTHEAQDAVSVKGLR